ncbi:MAG TPA: arylsulfatase [Lachnospiraceae bacterium]|nr:arylsulfatase [Lachnospiraceae bacterium]
MAKKRKNILLIMSDQQRMDTVGAYNMKEFCDVKTPNIDRLAQEGMKFNNAYTPSAICAPARAAIMTGLYPHTNGVIDNFTDYKPGVSFLGQCMHDAGYYCGYAGKWHVSPSRTPRDCGFDDGKPFMGYAFPGSGVYKHLIFNQPPDNKPNYYEEWLKEHDGDGVDVSHGFLGDNPALQIQEMFCKLEGRVEDSIEYFVADETRRLIDKAKDTDKPFFIWANFWGPHSPSIVPEPYYSMYDPASFPEHPSYKDDMLDKPYGYWLTEKMWGLGDYGWKGFQEIFARYAGHCTLIDDMVGLIVKKLKETGLYDDTVIVYTCDHGDCMGAHKLIEKGAFTFDEIYHIPMVVKGLGHTDNDSFVYLHELMPTFLDIAGTQPPTPVQGKSFLDLMEDGSRDNGRTEVYGEYHNHFYVARQRMVRDHEYQLTFNESERGELYDLKKDPYQIHNVCYDPAYAKVKEKYMNIMSKHMKELGDPAGVWFHRIKQWY